MMKPKVSSRLSRPTALGGLEDRTSRRDGPENAEESIEVCESKSTVGEKLQPPNEESTKEHELVVADDSESFAEPCVDSSDPADSVRDSNTAFVQPENSIVSRLPPSVILHVLEHVDQFDLVSFLQTCTQAYSIAVERLYRRVTVVLNAGFPVKYGSDTKKYIQDCSIRHMDLAMIFSPEKLVKFIGSISANEFLVSKVKYFVFDKSACQNLDLDLIQSELVQFFGSQSCDINFLHVTFSDLISGIVRLTQFLQNSNIRTRIFKLFITDLLQLYIPFVPTGLSNLFMMFDDLELKNTPDLDLSSAPYSIFNSLSVLTCSTNAQFGQEILRKLQLVSNDIKLQLSAFTLFHCHREDVFSEESLFGITKSTKQLENHVKSIDKKLDFDLIESKIELTSLHHLFLKIDCFEHLFGNCNCLDTFFRKITAFSDSHDGLPNLKSFELELYPNYEWLRPHQILDSVLAPLGDFLKSLSNLERLTVDFLTPAFKMFENSMEMSSSLLNQLNERLMLVFFLSMDKSTKTVKTLQFPDLLTSFLYYKAEFYLSLLHTCQCQGCQSVLDLLKEKFLPLDDESEDGEETLDTESAYYVLIGFILGKLQADREVCIPIKPYKFNYNRYPMHKGQAHTLHQHFHTKRKCDCMVHEDPYGLHELNIDTLVTTYIIHQLAPIVRYLSTEFRYLESLMVHGIYYDAQDGVLIPTYDNDEYPASLVQRGVHSNLPFGEFRGQLQRGLRSGRNQ